jgi:polyferredoxin
VTRVTAGLEAWIEHAVSNIKLLDQALSGMEGSYVEMLTLLSIGLLAVVPVLVPVRRRQAFRHLTQLAGMAVFIFVVYTCMGVFGMIRNAFRGLSEIGHENILAFYFCSVPATILATSMIFGPTFCGWMCPTGALQEFAGRLVEGWHQRRRAAGWPFSLTALALVVCGAILFLLCVAHLSRARLFFVEDSSLYWAEIILLLQVFLLVRMARWDRPLRRLRVLSFVVVVGASVAGWWITSPVHLVFAKVYDPASLLSTVMVVLAALVIPRCWCRYLCPWREAIGWAARHSTRRIESDTARCNGCGRCDAVCGVDAVHHGVVEPRECHFCLRCVDSCPTRAIRLVEEWKAEEGGPS